MLKNCNRLNDVVTSILDVTEIESGTMQLVMSRFDLRELLDELIGLHAEWAADKQLSWDCRFNGDNHELVADRRRVRQIFSELIVNAVKFSSVGGRISVHTRSWDGWLEVEIANTGMRIEATRRRNVFEKFSQGNQTNTRTVGGCGLGLYLVHNIVRLHGGQVELLEREGDETAFAVRMPMLREPVTEANALRGPDGVMK